MRMTHLVLLPLREGQVEDLLEVLCLHLAIGILLCQLGEVSGTEYTYSHKTRKSMQSL